MTETPGVDTELQGLRSALAQLERPWRALQRNSERLAERRERYLELFEYSPEAYVMTGPYCVVEAANRAAVCLIGSPAHELAGKPFVVLVHMDERREFRRRLAAVNAGGSSPAAWRARVGREEAAVLLAVSPMQSGLCWSLREAA